jgi:Fic-DOC domain mobile mystery protein B
MTALYDESDSDGAPLTYQDFDGLIPNFVASRSDLNLVEQANIESATLWAFGERRVASVEKLLTNSFADRVHRQMFGDVWRWAGKRRIRTTNIGIEPPLITTRMKLLFDDALHWHLHETYNSAELAVRLHHQLVSIHPYRNGNGRHARFMADLYLHLEKASPLVWGSNSTEVTAATRRTYITALQSADHGDYTPLISFAQSI